MTVEKENTISFTYIDQLTWLRGIAALFVIVSHTLRATEVKYDQLDKASSSSILSFFDLGNFGVVLFFALSGCTLFISNSDKVAYNQVVTFYIKRFFRIWPAFVVSLLFYMLFRLVFAHFYGNSQGFWVEKQFLSSYSISDVLSYISLISNFTGPDELFNNAFWSLPVEFQYYLIFPLIILSLKYVGVIGPVVIGLLIYLLPKLGLFESNDNSLFMLAFSFCGGVIIGYLYKRSSFRFNLKLSMALLVGLLIIVSAITNSYIRLPDFPIISTKSNWKILIALLTIYIVLFTRFNINKKLEVILKHYGTISYSNYLYHNLFIGIAVLLIINLEIYDSNLRLFGTLLFTLVASQIAATLSYKYVEVPSIALGRAIVGSKKNNDSKTVVVSEQKLQQENT